MGRMVKCQYCEDKVDKDVAYVHSKKNYHEDCFKTWKKESSDYKELISYICDTFRLSKPTGMILKQIKTFKEEQDYKYKGMELALRYFYDTLDNKPKYGEGIGIIPFVYEDAKQNFVQQRKIIMSLSNLDNEHEIVAYIDTRKTRRKSKSIDISTI